MMGGEDIGCSDLLAYSFQKIISEKPGTFLKPDFFLSGKGSDVCRLSKKGDLQFCTRGPGDVLFPDCFGTEHMIEIGGSQVQIKTGGQQMENVQKGCGIKAR
jgi:hypothetical protein